MYKKLYKLWKSYRYRFVPYLWLSMSKKNNNQLPSKLSPDSTTTTTSPKLVINVHHVTQEEDSKISVEELVTFMKQFFIQLNFTTINSPEKDRIHISHKNEEIMYKSLGFCIGRRQSTLAGTGVFVTQGIIHKGSIVALYPGTIYLPSEPLFFQSIGNSFIFRCQDGLLVDGNCKSFSLSKSIYKSCSYRDQFSYEIPCCDLSWQTSHAINPMNIGQYINNESGDHEHNVIYQEFILELPTTSNEKQTLPYYLWKYLPNVWYNPQNNSYGIKIIPLVATRNIEKDEELLSSYFTMLYD